MAALNVMAGLLIATLLPDLLLDVPNGLLQASPLAMPSHVGSHVEPFACLARPVADPALPSGRSGCDSKPIERLPQRQGQAAQKAELSTGQNFNNFCHDTAQPGIRSRKTYAQRKCKCLEPNLGVGG